MSVGGIMQFLLSELLDRITVLEFPNAVAMHSPVMSAEEAGVK